MLALSNSEIPINNHFASVCLLLSQKGEYLPDPCIDEEQEDVLFFFIVYYIEYIYCNYSLF